MKNLKGKIVAVTGAASGIGRALALDLASEGCHLAISDIDKKGLKETGGMIGNKKSRVSIHVVDVADLKQVRAFAKAVVKEHGGVDVIINNAGVAIQESIEDLKYEDFEWLMGINLWGVIYGSKEFLPYLKQRPEAHIVNISSVNGIFTDPHNGAYCTAKFGVRGFTETLAQEMDGSTVKVSCVHPGGIKTNISRNALFYKPANPAYTREEAIDIFDNVLARTTAEKAAEIIVAGIKKDRLRIMVGPDAYMLDWLKRLFPVGLQKRVGQWSRGQKKPLWAKKKKA